MESASVLAKVEGCAVVGAWVSPESRLAVERISARSCFLYVRKARQFASVLMRLDEACA